jgi:hypothetical protein
MVLYVLLTWMSALVLVLLAELFAFSYMSQPLSFAAPTHQHLAAVSVASNPYAFYAVWALFLFVLGCFLGYTLETRVQLIKKAYDQLQKTYPSWYSQWHAPRRELSLSLWFSALLVTLNLVALIFTFPRPPYFTGLPITLGCVLGLIILPALRYRKSLVEDRPAQAPQAVLHKVKPTYSNARALQIGQIYLRLLLPLFSLFLTLVLPLSLNFLNITTFQGALLLTGLALGLLTAWKVQPESHMSISHFRENFYQLSALLVISSGLLIFGIASGNSIEIFFFTFCSGYLSGTY